MWNLDIRGIKLHLTETRKVIKKRTQRKENANGKVYYPLYLVMRL